MIHRDIYDKVKNAMAYFPVVGIIGPRQSGKTTLVKSLEGNSLTETLFLDLERDSDLQKLKEAEIFLSQYQNKCATIDEVQQLPGLFPLIRWLIDQDRRPARFILTGSASPDLIKSNTETLAGRIAYFELMPFSLTEIQSMKSIFEHWFRGGFHGSLFAPSDEFSQLWLENFIDTYLQRDIRKIGFEISVPAMERLLRVLASGNGSLLNVESISKSLGISVNTVKKYLDILEGSFIIRRLQPMYLNITKRLVRSPKIYIRDTGVLHKLLGLRDSEQLQGSVWLGHSWESYVIEEIVKACGKSFEYFFYRTQTGAEVDLVLQGGKTNSTTMVEIKYSINTNPSKGYHIASEDIKPANKYVLIPEGELWIKSDQIKVCGLYWFLTKELPNL